jgi:hypothetical protein
MAVNPRKMRHSSTLTRDMQAIMDGAAIVTIMECLGLKTVTSRMRGRLSFLYNNHYLLMMNG